MTELDLPPQSRHSTALDIYFKEIRSAQPLTPEQEVELARRIRGHDRQALHELLVHNLRFVVMVAKKFQGRGLSLEDLINEGNLGLIKAALRFDETRGFKFISYAVWWVRQSILSSIADGSRLVRLPQNVMGRVRRIQRVSSSLTQEYEREPTHDEVASEMHLPAEVVSAAFTMSAGHLSLDAPLGAEENTLKEVLADAEDRPESQILIQSLAQDVRHALGTLESVEAVVLRMYFGIDCEHSYTLDEISGRLHLTGERVRQIKEKGLRKLRHRSRAKSLKGYLG